MLCPELSSTDVYDFAELETDKLCQMFMLTKIILFLSVKGGGGGGMCDKIVMTSS